MSDLDSWRVQVESASQHFDGLLGGLRGNWYRMEERFDQIANRLEHKRTPRAIDCSPYQQQVQQVSGMTNMTVPFSGVQVCCVEEDRITSAALGPLTAVPTNSKSRHVQISHLQA